MPYVLSKLSSKQEEEPNIATDQLIMCLSWKPFSGSQDAVSEWYDIHYTTSQRKKTFKQNHVGPSQIKIIPLNLA